MVFQKLKQVFSGTDEKYEMMLHKYSQLKSENKALEDKCQNSSSRLKEDLSEAFANILIKIYEDIEVVKEDSFRVRAMDKDLQKLMIDINKAEKTIKEFLVKFSVEEVMADEKLFDPQIYDVATYQESKGLPKGSVLKTAKKGFKYKGKLVKKPKVVVVK